MIFKVQEKYFNQIKNGIKTAEGRINKPKFAKLKSGDMIIFSPNSNPSEQLQARVVNISIYNNFNEMLKNGDNLKKLLPDVETVEDGVKIYESFGDYKTAQFEYGVISIEFKVFD